MKKKNYLWWYKKLSFLKILMGFNHIFNYDKLFSSSKKNIIFYVTYFPMRRVRTAIIRNNASTRAPIKEPEAHKLGIK